MQMAIHHLRKEKSMFLKSFDMDLFKYLWQLRFLNGKPHIIISYSRTINDCNLINLIQYF